MWQLRYRTCQPFLREWRFVLIKQHWWNGPRSCCHLPRSAAMRCSSVWAPGSSVIRKQSNRWSSWHHHCILERVQEQHTDIHEIDTSVHDMMWTHARVESELQEVVAMAAQADFTVWWRGAFTGGTEYKCLHSGLFIKSNTLFFSHVHLQCHVNKSELVWYPLN